MPHSLYPRPTHLPSFFFFNDTAPTEIYTLSLHDALPISECAEHHLHARLESTTANRLVECDRHRRGRRVAVAVHVHVRSEEHTSELQSQSNLVCRLLLEKKKKKTGPRSAQSRLPTGSRRA